MDAREHRRHLAEALQHFVEQHGDYSQWDDQDRAWFHRLMTRINKHDLLEAARAGDSESSAQPEQAL